MPGLTVTRRVGQKIVCHVADGQDITFTLQALDGRQAQINIQAPGSVRILRNELEEFCHCPACERARLRIRAVDFLRDNSDPETIAVREFLLRWLEELEAIKPTSGPAVETIARATGDAMGVAAARVNGNGVRLDFACPGLRS